ncbi:MAG: hypothetical protein H7Z13_02020 [Ferruginibacter sp.]|nr:hypothetical protein [Ferruginibacter sp.]
MANFRRLNLSFFHARNQHSHTFNCIHFFSSDGNTIYQHTFEAIQGLPGLPETIITLQCGTVVETMYSRGNKNIDERIAGGNKEPPGKDNRNERTLGKTPVAIIRKR